MKPQDEQEIIRNIDAYLNGRLNDSEIDDLWEQLLEHPTYLEYLETELALKAVYLRQESDNPKRSVYSRLTHLPYIAWGAAAAVILLAVILPLALDQQSNPAERLAMSKIDLMENMAAPMVVRSPGTKLGPADSLMNIGFEAALSGDLDRARELYEEVIERHEGNAEEAQALMNIGIICYNRGAYARAGEFFQRSLDRLEGDLQLRQKINWFLGNSYLKSGRLADARTALTRTVDLDGPYRSPAQELLDKLEERLDIK